MRGLRGGATAQTTCGGAFCAHGRLQEGRSDEDQADDQQTAWLHAESFRVVRQISAKDQNPDHREQQQRHEYRRGTDVLGETRELVALEADAVDRGFDGAVDQLDDQHEEHRRDQQRALDAVAT